MKQSLLILVSVMSFSALSQFDSSSSNSINTEPSLIEKISLQQAQTLLAENNKPEKTFLILGWGNLANSP